MFTATMGSVTKQAHKTDTLKPSRNTYFYLSAVMLTMIYISNIPMK